MIEFDYTLIPYQMRIETYQFDCTVVWALIEQVPLLSPQL